jgi:hypothetical protein
MSLIGTLITGAGNPTNIVGQKKLDMFLLIGDVDTANPLQGLTVELDGVAFFSVANAATLLTAYAKWQQELTGSTLGVCFKLATGCIEGSVNYRLTNAGATTPSIYASSEVDNGVPFYVSTDTINALSSQTYEKFSALFLQTPATVSTVELEFYRNPDNKDEGTYRETMTIQEVDMYFSLYNQAETDGRLGGVSVIDNTRQNVKSVKINVNNVGALTVLQAKLPDDAFKALQRAGKF